MIRLSSYKIILRILPLIILLLTPLLVAAAPIHLGQIIPVNVFLLEILENIGRFFLNSPLGQLFLKLGDAFIDVMKEALNRKISCGGSHRVIPDLGDQLQGYLDGCYTIQIDDTLCQIIKPRMFRPTIHEPWDIVKSLQNVCR